MDGIDTKEEYRQNKRTLQSEREQLLRSISQLQNAQVQLPCETAPPRNPEQIHNIIDILQSDRFSMQQKNRALKSIVDKIIVDRDKMHIDIYYHLHR